MGELPSWGIDYNALNQSMCSFRFCASISLKTIILKFKTITTTQMQRHTPRIPALICRSKRITSTSRPCLHSKFQTSLCHSDVLTWSAPSHGSSHGALAGFVHDAAAVFHFLCQAVVRCVIAPRFYCLLIGTQLLCVINNITGASSTMLFWERAVNFFLHF